MDKVRGLAFTIGQGFCAMREKLAASYIGRRLTNRPMLTLLGAGVLLVVLSLGVATLVTTAHAAASMPDPATQTPKERRAYMASREFGRQTAEARRQYVIQVKQLSDGQSPRMWGRDGSLSESERKQLRENMKPVMIEHMRKEVDAFFRMTPEEQTAHLDKVIDKKLEVIRNHAPQADRGGARGAPDEGKGRRKGFNPQRLKKKLEGIPAEDRARAMEYRKAIRDRMEARGIDPSQFKPGRSGRS